MSASSGARPREAGETLIELLISMVVIGIMGAAVIGAVMLAVDVSMMHKDEVQVQQVLRSWAEKVSNATDATFAGCGTAACLVALAPTGTGLSVSADQIECWTGSAFGACTAGANSTRRVRLTVSSSGGPFAASQSLRVVVRRPCLAASSC